MLASRFWFGIAENLLPTAVLFVLLLFASVLSVRARLFLLISRFTEPNSVKSSAMKMALTPIENKKFTARYDANPIFMLGGAPTAHEVLSECGHHRIAVSGKRVFLGLACVHCGGSELRYAEIEIMSSSERFETTFFIRATAVPALDPF